MRAARRSAVKQIKYISNIRHTSKIGYRQRENVSTSQQFLGAEVIENETEE